MLWLVGGGVQRWVSDNSHMRCRMGMVVWGRMCGNMDMGESLDHCFDVYNKHSTALPCTHCTAATPVWLHYTHWTPTHCTAPHGTSLPSNLHCFHCIALTEKKMLPATSLPSNYTVPMDCPHILFCYLSHCPKCHLIELHFDIWLPGMIWLVFRRHGGNWLAPGSGRGCVSLLWRTEGLSSA